MLMKNNKHRYIFKIFNRVWTCRFLITGLIIMVSCNKNSYDNRQLNNKLVILTEITAGDTANIPIGSSLPAGNGNAIVFEKLNAVRANITDPNGTTETLGLNSGTDFISNPLAVYSGSLPFQYNTAYTLTAEDSRLGTAVATTTIPNDFYAMNTETEADDLNGRKVFRFAFRIDDAGNEKNYYIFESVKQLVRVSRYFFWQGIKYDYNQPPGYNMFQQVKNNPGVVLLLDTVPVHQFIRLNVYTKDLHTGNALMSSLDSPFRRIFITDTLFNGQTYEGEIWIAMDHFNASNPQETGIVQVQVKSVSKELYDYLIQYENYNQDFGVFNVGSLTSPVGNVKNGFGVFGGSVRKQWSFYYDPLQ
jgi:hypothetical protein